MYYREKMVMSQLTEKRIILVGKTGNGKSSTGNSLLRREAFKHEISPNAVTDKCELKTGTDMSNHVRYTVVDTPGLFDTSISLGQRALEIQKSVEICRKPHAFLIVFSAKNRMTEEEKYTIDMFRIIFGNKVFDHMIVTFTHGEEFNSEKDFNSFWFKNKEFAELINLCGNRVARTANKKGFEVYSENEDLGRIINMVTEMADRKNGVYDYEHLRIHKKVIEEHARKYTGTGNIHDEVSELVKKLGDKLPSGFWKVILYASAFVGVCTIAGAGVGLAAGGVTAKTVAATGAGSAVINNAAVFGGAIARTVGATGSRIGTVVISTGAAVGSVVVRAAWNLVSNRFR